MDQRVAPPTSMYSMKRTSAATRLPNSMRSTSSSSFTPRITTVSSFVPVKPARVTVWMPSRTWAWLWRRVSAANRSARRVSRLTVTRWSPASLSVPASSASSTPLVVIARARLGGEEADEARQVAPEERLAARETDLVHPEIHEDVGERADLLEVEDLLAREPDVVLLGHAVLAAQVASVGDRDAEVPERPTVGVVDPHQTAPAATATSARARSHSRISPAFFTPTSKWSHGRRSSVERVRVVQKSGSPSHSRSARRQSPSNAAASSRKPATRRSPRASSAWSAASRGFSWNTRTFENRRTPRLTISSFAWSDSAPSKGAHWKGVQGFGTKDETDSVKRPNGFPDGSSTRRRSSIRSASSGMASTSASVSVGWPIMK